MVKISWPELYLTYKVGYRILTSHESNFILELPLSKDDNPMANNSISALHHFNCCTNRPRVGRLFNERKPCRVVSHCLLLETDRGLVLIDIGWAVMSTAMENKVNDIYFFGYVDYVDNIGTVRRTVFCRNYIRETKRFIAVQDED